MHALVLLLLLLLAPLRLRLLVLRSYGEVYNAREIATGRIVAIKVIPVESDLDQVSERHECLVSSSVQPRSAPIHA